ncbi:MAG: PIG-L family deacetylase [Kofleriaceae bacterium]
MTTVIVSPHLDDAALSLGGSIARWTAAGERVVIATVYTTGPPLEELAPEMHAFADYATRTAEDAAACRLLGAESLHLGHVERAFRQPFLAQWSFFHTPARSGFEPIDLAAIAALDPDRIVLPLGIGNHVDHVAVLVAAWDWANRCGLRDRLRFYEDFYALSAPLRALHPVARTRMWTGGDAPLAGSPELAAILETIAERAGGPGIDELLGPCRWTVEVSPIDEPRSLAAIACYATQIRTFGGRAGVTSAYQRFHAWWGGEPLWSAVGVE